MFARVRSIGLAVPRLVAAVVVIGLATFVTVLPAQVAGAADDVVTNCNGSGAGSLPAVVAAASSGDTITFSVTCPPSSPITLSSTIGIGVNLTIDGPGARELAVSGNNAVEVFDIAATVTLSGLTVEDGTVMGGNGGGISNFGTLSISGSNVDGNAAENIGLGGGIYNAATLNINDSSVSNNFGSEGGGMVNFGTATVFNSTLSENLGGGLGAGINNEGQLTVVDSTISDNDGIGIDTYQGDTSIAAGTILAENSGNCDGSITDAGYNLDDDGSCGFSAANSSQSDAPADLGPLQNNGGPTKTQAPGLGSPALNRIPLGTMANGVTLCPGTDQRGVSRPQGSECDIGAVEVVIPQAITSPNNATATTGSHFSFPVTTSGSPVPIITEKGTLPKRLIFTNNGDGTANIVGKPRISGVYHLTIKATFGSGSTKYVVSQSFALTIDPA